MIFADQKSWSPVPNTSTGDIDGGRLRFNKKFRPHSFLREEWSSLSPRDSSCSSGCLYYCKCWAGPGNDRGQLARLCQAGCGCD